jgi:hypothetical protein
MGGAVGCRIQVAVKSCGTLIFGSSHGCSCDVSLCCSGSICGSLVMLMHCC